MTERASTGETSVGRALRVVETVADAGDGVTAKAIARRLGYSLPTTYRLLSMLVEEGYLVRLHDLRGYGLGYRIGTLARRLTEQLAVPYPVRAAVREAHEQIEAAAYYVVCRGDRAVVAHLEGCAKHPGRPRLRCGEPLPVRRTAAGKVLLACRDRRRAPTLDGTQLTPELARELQRVQEVGVAVQLDEPAPGWAGVAAAVRSDAGVTGALALSVRRTELAERRGALEWSVRDAARRIGAALTESGLTA